MILHRIRFLSLAAAVLCAPLCLADAPVYAVWPHAFPYLTESVDVGAVKYIYREAFAGLGLLRHVDLGEAEILE